MPEVTVSTPVVAGPSDRLTLTASDARTSASPSIPGACFGCLPGGCAGGAMCACFDPEAVGPGAGVSTLCGVCPCCFDVE
jgi:hypothetical protein